MLRYTLLLFLNLYMPLTCKLFTLGKHLDMQPVTLFTSVAAYVTCPLTFIVPPTINFTQNNQVDILRIQSTLLQNDSDFQSFKSL